MDINKIIKIQSVPTEAGKKEIRNKEVTNGKQ